MDMILDKSEMNCRRLIWSGTVRKEEMAESVVPDTYPDAECVADVCTQVFIRGKEASAGKVTVDAAALCTVLYTASGTGELCRMEMELPFSLQAEVPDAGEDTDIVAELTLCDAEARLLNPRKILTRAELSARISCYVPGTVALSVSMAEKSGLQLLRKSCTAAPVTDVREKTFVLSDELNMPPSPEGYSRILCQDAALSTEDVRFVGSKLIFKGEVLVRVLAEPNGGASPVFFSSSSSFSQIIELSCEAEDAEVSLGLTGLFLSLGESEGGKPCVAAEIHVLAQAVARVEREVEYIADAYSNKSACRTGFETVELPGRGQRICMRDTWRCELRTEETAASVICAGARCTEWRIAEQAVTARIAVRCMYLTADGKAHGAVCSGEMRIEGEIPENAECLFVRCGEVYAVPAAGGIDIRVPLEAGIGVRGGCELRLLSSLELDEEADRPERASLYIIPAAEDADLWQLAKRYGSTVEHIKMANPEWGSVLLVPSER
ncbi:MAG: DUF3794 domain-containing protein [Candidatus Heteroscillospira sp.]|jgi:hypothetical protein